MKINKTSNSYNFGYIKIKPVSNNIFITITDISGNVLISKHAGLLGIKGSKKKTPYIASQVLKDIIEELNQSNIYIKLYILQIFGYIRSSTINNVIKELNVLNVNNIFYIEYKNIKSHGLMRLKKKRRL